MLVAGPTVSICDECIRLCKEMLDEHERARGRRDRPGHNPEHNKPASGAKTASDRSSAAGPASAGSSAHDTDVPLSRNVRLDDSEMVNLLVRLCNAYAASDSDTIRALEPEATRVGQILHERGGIREMRRVFRQVPSINGKATLEMHWDGVGDWRG